MAPILHSSEIGYSHYDRKSCDIALLKKIGVPHLSMDAPISIPPIYSHSSSTQRMNQSSSKCKLIQLQTLVQSLHGFPLAYHHFNKDKYNSAAALVLGSPPAFLCNYWTPSISEQRPSRCRDGHRLCQMNRQFEGLKWCILSDLLYSVVFLYGTWPLSVFIICYLCGNTASWGLSDLLASVPTQLAGVSDQSCKQILTNE